MRQRYSTVLLATLSLGLGLVASNAQASYSGSPERGVCPQAALVNGHASGGWGTFEPNEWTPKSFGDICGLTPFGTGAGAYIAIPYDTKATSVSGTQEPAIELWTHGDNNANQVCLWMYAIDDTGSFSSSSTTSCTTGTSVASSQSLTAGGITIPAQGSIVGVVTAVGAGTLDMFVWQQFASGT